MAVWGGGGSKADIVVWENEFMSNSYENSF